MSLYRILLLAAFLTAALFYFQFLCFVCPRPFTVRRRVFIGVFTILNAAVSTWLDLNSPYVTAVIMMLIACYMQVALLHHNAIGHAQTLYYSGIFLFVRLCIHGIIIPTLAFLNGLNMRGIVYNDYHHLLSTAVSCVLCSLAMLFYVARHSRDEADLLFRYSRQGWLSTLTMYILLIYLLMETYVYRLTYETFNSLSFHLLTSGLALAGFYLIFIYAAHMSKFIEYQVETRYMELQLKRQLQHYEQYTRYVSELREFRHDYHRMKESVRNLLESGDTQQALALLGQMEQCESTASDTQYSNNVIIDAILRECAILCKKNDIDYHAQVTVPAQTGLSDLDLCRIFGNLVDNAVEACMRMEDGARFIDIKSTVSGNWLTVEFLNSFSGELTIVNGLPKTIKKDRMRHGLGLRSVQRIVEATGGFIRIQTSPEKTFSARLHLSLPPQADDSGQSKTPEQS